MSKQPPKEPGRRGGNHRFISLGRRCMSQLFACAYAVVARDRKRRHGDRSHIYFPVGRPREAPGKAATPPRRRIANSASSINCAPAAQPVGLIAPSRAESKRAFAGHSAVEALCPPTRGATRSQGYDRAQAANQCRRSSPSAPPVAAIHRQHARSVPGCILSLATATPHVASSASRFVSFGAF